MLLYMLFFLGFKIEIPGRYVITQMDAMQTFLELIWLLHVIVCVVFLFFFFGGGGGVKTENLSWFVIT